MSDNNGWPDPKRPGVPVNPEKDGWHWVKQTILPKEAALWTAKPWRENSNNGLGDWVFSGNESEYDPSEIKDMSYVGPCLAPDEIEKLRAERDALRALLHEKDRNLVQHALSQQLITRAALGEKE